MLVLLTGGPFDGRDFEVTANFKSTLHLSDPRSAPVHPDPRLPEVVTSRYRPTSRKAADGRVIYEFVAPKAAGLNAQAGPPSAATS